jgi:hypothetical protein
MADAVTSQLIANGPRNWGYVFTNLSDGTGESGVVKVDGSASGPLGVVNRGQTFYPLSNIKITEIEYDVKGMALEIIWDATSSQNAIVLCGFGKMHFYQFGGLAAVSSTGAVLTGATGKIKFTTLGAMPNSGYTVYLRGTKGIPQS